MSLSLTQYGALDIGYMSSLTNMERADLITELVTSNHAYLDHESFSRGVEAYVPADEYLSGNIRRKIQAVEGLIETAPQFARNLSDLKAVMPRDLGPQEIRVRINSPIVGTEHVKDFIAEAWDLNNVKSQYIPNTGEWKIDIKYPYHSKTNEIDTKTFGYTGDVKNDAGFKTGIQIQGRDILDKIMNGKPVKIEVKKEGTDFSGKKISVIDRKATDMATAIAQDKADAIANAFTKWIWRDTERTNDIVKRYNETFNSTVPRKFTHPERMKNPDANIYLHGCAFHSPLRPHQADAIWRIIQQKNTMLAHAVGAGKTLEMACAAMEMRRLGLRNKPMIVCPNHMIKQWAKEVREAYPAAKLLIADDKNWNAQNRKAFINRVATGDWDAVIIRSTSFKYIAVSPEKQLEFLEQKKREFEEYLSGISEENRWTRKNIERRIAGYEERIKKLSDIPKDDDAINFEMLGVDHLFIDEADMFKNLEYSTQLVGVKGLGTPTGSERSFDMFMKIQHVQSGGGGVTFATGTPVSNTLVEAYTMQRYLQPQELELNGLTAFDSWVRQFAEAVTTMELNNTGTDFKSSTRLSKIVNVPELMTSLRQVWDIKTADDLERMGILVPGKNLPHKKVMNVVAPSTPLLKSYLKHLDSRESCLSGSNQKGADNILTIIGDGRKAAIDMRLINPHLPDDPNSKLNLAVKIIHDTYKKYEKERYTVAVFLDRACSYDKKTGALLFDAVEDIKSKLISLGVKREEIEDAGDKKYTEGNNKYDKRQEMFSRVNERHVRVVIGSTETMGAGTNFQKNLKAIVHVDVPWRPRDIEQQNGRGYRSGNQTGELEIYNLTTRGSLDAGLYAVLETKQKLISQV
ncbi:MAG: DEAD/DEAH box helicase family protein, partial [Chitinispirillales bacterium]|nr:DEAD/DEAH box helicase family protein [Chitinispirillales bacterium]